MISTSTIVGGVTAVVTPVVGCMVLFSSKEAFFIEGGETETTEANSDVIPTSRATDASLERSNLDRSDAKMHCSDDAMSESTLKVS